MSTRRIHAIAGQTQYRRHVDAVWRHIDPDLRGEAVYGRSASARNIPRGDVVMIGGFYDFDRAPEHEIIYVEHGAGQSYNGDPTMVAHPAYHGGLHPDRVLGYICPNERVAAAWPKPAYVAGCPALDGHNPNRQVRFKEARVAAITFHWDARRVCSEAWSARDWYIDELHNMVGALRSSGFAVIGHAHPRDVVAPQIWRNLQVDFEPDPDVVLATVHLLVADNTSLQYEAAKLRIPNIVLNAPWYRRDVSHGLRFWDHVPGVMVDDPVGFVRMSHTSYVNGVEPYLVARSCGDYAFPVPVGHAGEDAARWIEKLVAEQA